jgi:hypothetical protein
MKFRNRKKFRYVIPAYTSPLRGLTAINRTTALTRLSLPAVSTGDINRFYGVMPGPSSVMLTKSDDNADSKGI